LISGSATEVRVRSQVTAAKLFVTELGMPCWVGLELMAQAMAAWAGKRAQDEQKPVKVGFLLGTRRFESTMSHFPLGAQLFICAKEELVSDDGLAVFKCEIQLDDQVVAWAQVTALQPPDVQKFISENIA
jgi:predicted hotdog family 3-hydroxylacyl-ACP dehydratase